ncbi:E3 ubiquitin-protein ligase RFI2-like [Senna tora]|uniref:E3 ubiquitin-protein ligase RFI2-like n=1 Tax=Senna tora TaxID=362788 RepID=A0A834WYG4_9FABA|nr:E3 ubiquitin-protein ligase RFI2-like [Senna tora]
MATPAPPPAPAPSTICSICLEDVSANCGKTVVTLQCSDVFHLDCIGSAFNAKGSMQCPNCQAVENGVWRQFENERLPPAENVMMNVDTNDDEDLIAMVVNLPAGPNKSPKLITGWLIA